MSNGSPFRNNPIDGLLGPATTLKGLVEQLSEEKNITVLRQILVAIVETNEALKAEIARLEDFFESAKALPAAD
jgi:hypothetical protein